MSKVIHTAITIREFDTEEAYDAWVRIYARHMLSGGFAEHQIQTLLDGGQVEIEDEEYGVRHTKTTVSTKRVTI